MTSALLLSALLAGPADAAPPPKPAASEKAAPAAPAVPGAPAAVAASTTPAQPTVQDIYGGDAYRDPFTKLGAAGAAVQAPSAAAAAEFKVEDFSIHTLELKGIMRDRSGPIAILADTNSHVSFTLRGGRLYGPKKKIIPGVTGTVRPERKTVTLMTADKDVQTLRLGEDADPAED